MLDHARHLITALAAVALAACGPEDAADSTQAEDELVATPTGPAIPINPVPVGQPDLIVGGLAVPAGLVLHCGPQTLPATALEQNVGTGAAGRHFLHLQRLNTSNNQFVGASALALAGLGAGASRAINNGFNFYNGPCDCLPSTYTITFRLFDDGGNLVAESNEANNASNTVVVNAACP